ncbi:S-phase kinase-associated protein 1 [Tupaia chinensis]|uniref:S-phase kinase-associated protein 1 n=1 Tax=Tupaia chinensis TaxID=246437 RepID=L9KJ71_TUPCH|nr:S-phase kinase-associated protein 1 [Tupaia chinensis]
MRFVKLQSSGGEMFGVDVEIVEQSVTARTMLEELGMDDKGGDDQFSTNVNAAIFQKAISCCTCHKDDPPPPEAPTRLGRITSLCQTLRSMQNPGTLEPGTIHVSNCTCACFSVPGG